MKVGESGKGWPKKSETERKMEAEKDRSYIINKKVRHESLWM